MPILKAIEENFRFLVIEVKKQLEDTLKIIRGIDKEQLREKIEARDDYIDSLKNIIENKASTFFLSSENIDKSMVVYIRAITTITSNLEKIADYAVNISFQTGYYKKPDFIEGYNYNIFFEKILNALSKISESVYRRDINLALKICKTEIEVDNHYSEIIAKIIKELEKRNDVENLITTLFIFQYLERIGDSILNIGEAIMSIVLGERIKVHQYQAIADTIYQGIDDGGEYEIEAVAESRSGNVIRRVREVAFEKSSWVIFKEGKATKIDKEKEGIEVWAKIDPAIVPKIYGFEKKGNDASIIIEYLKGRTLKDILINYSQEDLFKALEVFTEKVFSIWEKTIEEKEINTTYFKQLSKRIEDVYTVHPEFKAKKSKIGDIEILPLEKIISAVSILDDELKAPFSVIIHGDFNLDNIIYNENNKTIHYIDLHRAKRADYIQDVSVFLVSNFRLPFFEKEIREKINYSIMYFYKMASKFALEHKDNSFFARLSAGLARSYITSTRFELDKDFAKHMYLKAIYLLESLINFNSRNWNEFILPEEILIY